MIESLTASRGKHLFSIWCENTLNVLKNYVLHLNTSKKDLDY